MIDTAIRQIRLLIFRPGYPILLFSLLLASYNLLAQEKVKPSFEFYSADNGLSENSITAIMQDRHGFMWIGTGDGLNRYDGYSFQTYRKDPTDLNSLSSNVIRFIFEDSKGGLWIGTNENVSVGGGPGVLNRLDRKSGIFERFEHDPKDPNSISSNQVTNIFEDSKNNLWICTAGSGLNHFDRKTGRFKAFNFDQSKVENAKSNTIYSVVEDSHGILWMNNANITYSVVEGSVGISLINNADAGLNSLNPSTGEIKRYQHDPGEPHSLSNNSVLTIFEDSEKVLWIGTSDGLNRFIRETDQFERYQNDPKDPQSLGGERVNLIYEDRQETLWIGTSNGLDILDRDTGVFQHFRHDQETSGSLCDNSVQNIYEEISGNLWIQTGRSIALLNRDRQTFTCIPIPRNIGTVFPDVSSNIWLGSMWTGAKGLSRMDLISANLQHFQHDPQNPNSLTNNIVWPILEDSDGYVWIGTIPSMGNTTSSGGLDRLDRTTDKFKHFKHDPDDSTSIAQNEIFSLFEDSQGYLWVGYNKGILDRLDRKTGKVVERFEQRENDPNTISIGPVISIMEDAKGHLWFGGAGGINRLDPNTGLFQHFVPFPEAENFAGDNWIEKIIMDQEGNLWAGTWYRGLLCLNPGNGQFTNFEHDPDNSNTISHNGVWTIHIDAQGCIWAGTGFGLNRLDPHTGEFKYYHEKDGLPNSYIFGILQDDQGRLWLSTNKGIAVFNSKTETTHSFDIQDGLQGNQFNYFSYFKSPKTGEFYFGGRNGFNIFHPDRMTIDSFAPPIAVSSFTSYSRKDGRSTKDDFISEKEKVSLSYRSNVISFEFAALNYRKTNKNQYKYQLTGFSDQWYELGNKREVTFVDLNPGNYILRVMAANGDGIWNPVSTELAIRILPPWWWSFWAKLLYLLFGVLLVSGLYRYQLHRKLAVAEARKLKELDSLKTKFYTNITHEFRTPLTVIQGISDQVIEQASELPREKIRENSRVVKRNSAQLLTMVNQMLDLRRLETGSLPVHLVKGDVLQYFRYLMESFHSYAQDRGVSLHFMTDLEELTIDYDPDKLLHIISNLLSNAIKFTLSGGNVYFSADKADVKIKGVTGEMLILKIKDTGIGISENQLPFIFNRFYSSNTFETKKGEGTGIGLALTRELVKLMQGTIEVKSKLMKGTSFILTLPITRNASQKAEKSAFMKDKILGTIGPPALKTAREAAAPDDSIDLPLALIIEDNPDVVRYLCTCLENDYQIVTSLNGKTGVDIAMEMIPDIILSDVMMPEKNGYEVCEILKSHEYTSHIPIILLTAKADQRSILEGLRKGADAYLPKPFHRDELKIRLEKLIEQRRKLQERYSKLEMVDPKKNVTTMEDAFLQKVRGVILEHIDDPEFGLEELSRAIGLSRSQLFRKLKALTNKSTSLVVRSIRLQKAKELLQTTDLNVSEVAFDVGFKDISYFSKCFIEEYGKQPSAVRAFRH